MEPGTLFADKYLISRVISSGSVGTVCEATHQLMGRRLVLKLVRGREQPSVDENQAWNVRFRREVRAASGIDSDHVVDVLEAGTDLETGLSFIVMEYLDGEDGSDWLRRMGFLGVSAALKVVAQACKGVCAAHEAGVLHRDIKPGNLFLAERGDGRVIVKLLDFGLAKAMARHAGLLSQTDITEPGSIVGTPSYMSPEQARMARDIDGRADVWSLGAVLHGLLSGYGPYQGPGKSPADVLLKLTTGQMDPPPVQDIVPWVSPEAAAIVHQALRHDREQRYPSAKAMLEDILLLVPEGIELQVRDLVPPSRTERGVVAPRMTAEHLQPRPRVFAVAEPMQPRIEVTQKSQASLKKMWWPLLTLLAVGAIFLVGWLVFRFIAPEELSFYSLETVSSTSEPAGASSMELEHDTVEPEGSASPIGSGVSTPRAPRPRTPRPTFTPKWTPPLTSPGF